jgi:hypothetical protein
MILGRLEHKGELIAGASFAGAFLVFIFFYATAPITDLDFWWHLKTGEVMVQNRGLLQTDPFTFTGDGVVSNREALILKGYWLWQLIAYGLYSLLGFNGIFLLNFLILGAMAGVVVQQMRRQGVGNILAVGLLTLGFYLLSATYTMERPQMVSFLFAAALLALLNRVRDGGQLGWTLPLLMMVWANLHGGFVVGDLILLCFATGAVIEYRHDLPRLRHLLLWVVVGISASLLNPNGALVFAEIFSFHNSALMTGIYEYQSTWVIFRHGSWFVVLLWLLIALYGVGIWSARRLYWPEFLVALFLAYFSVAYIRNVGFFAVAMLPAIGFSLQQKRALQSRSIARPWGYLIVFAAASLLLWQTSERWQKGSKEEILSSLYPEKAAQFILASGLQGRMFNSYNFGGYLIWKLYPQHLVFIDGRGLDVKVYNDWKPITGASLKEEGGRKEFEVLLDRYGIDYVVQQHIYRENGRLTPLLKFLLVKSEWIPIYADQQSYILVRNSQVNAAVIERYRMDKRDFSNKVIGYLTAASNSSPAEVIYQVALAEMLIFVGRYAEAGERLDMIARLQPGNPNLPSLHNQLDVLKNGKRP